MRHILIFTTDRGAEHSPATGERWPDGRLDLSYQSQVFVDMAGWLRIDGLVIGHLIGVFRDRRDEETDRLEVEP
jgi:hypothetical protein